MQEIDRRAIRNYFKPFPWWAVFCIIIGLPLLALKGLGLIPIAIGILGILLDKKPADQQMDAWFEEEIKVLNQHALKKLGVDDSDCVAAPVVVYGPRVENTGGAEILIKSGGDGLVRYTPVDFSVMHSGQHQLFCYQCSYDRTTGNRLAERTDEYFYRDVVSVATKTEAQQIEIDAGLKGKKEKIRLTMSESFVLTTSGGTEFSVFLTDPALLKLKATKGGQLQTTSQAETAIKAIRRMLREKKVEGHQSRVPRPLLSRCRPLFPKVAPFLPMVTPPSCES